LSSSKKKKSKTTTTASTTIPGTVSAKVDVDIDETTKVKIKEGEILVLGCLNAVKPFDINRCNHIWCGDHDPTKSKSDSRTTRGKTNDNGTTSGARRATASVARRASASTEAQCDHKCGNNCSVEPITDYAHFRYVFTDAGVRMTCKKEGCNIEFV